MSSSLNRVTVDERLDDGVLTLMAVEAAQAWQQFTKNEKALVRFGMFPADRMRELEAKFPAVRGGDRSRLLAVALMDCAKADGGMRA